MMGFEEWLMNEGIRVNYKNFEAMKMALKQYMDALDKFHYAVSNATARIDPRKAQQLDQYYQQNVSMKKKDLLAAYQWIDQKVRELMQNNNWERKGPSSTGAGAYNYGPANRTM